MQNDEYSFVKFMKLISFKITNSPRVTACLAWRQICYQVHSQIYSYKQATEHSPSHCYLIKIISLNFSIVNKHWKGAPSPDLCVAKYSGVDV